MMRTGKNRFRISDFRSPILGGHPAQARSAVRNPPSAIGGFTLAEVLVAATISGFIALVAVGALNAIAGSAKTVDRATETTTEVRFAARMLARDLTNLYRDPNPENVKLIGTSQGSETGEPPSLTFYMVGRAKARTDQPEGDVYEVEYFLGMREMEASTPGGSLQEATVLFRRLWPNPDKDREPGGILTPIAENIGLFQIRFFDGKQWGDQWTEQMRSLPVLVEVTLASLPPEKGDPVSETMTVTFPRLSKTLAGASQPGGSPDGQPGQQNSAADSAAGSPSAPAGGQSGSGNNRSR
jgi:general secretion pathway protein J